MSAAIDRHVKAADRLGTRVFDHANEMLHGLSSLHSCKLDASANARIALAASKAFEAAMQAELDREDDDKAEACRQEVIAEFDEDSL